MVAGAAMPNGAAVFHAVVANGAAAKVGTPNNVVLAANGAVRPKPNGVLASVADGRPHADVAINGLDRTTVVAEVASGAVNRVLEDQPNAAGADKPMPSGAAATAAGAVTPRPSGAAAKPKVVAAMPLA